MAPIVGENLALRALFFGSLPLYLALDHNSPVSFLLYSGQGGCSPRISACNSVRKETTAGPLAESKRSPFSASRSPCKAECCLHTVISPDRAGSASHGTGGTWPAPTDPPCSAPPDPTCRLLLKIKLGPRSAGDAHRLGFYFLKRLCSTPTRQLQ